MRELNLVEIESVCSGSPEWVPIDGPIKNPESDVGRRFNDVYEILYNASTAVYYYADMAAQAAADAARAAAEAGRRAAEEAARRYQ